LICRERKREGQKRREKGREGRREGKKGVREERGWWWRHTFLMSKVWHSL
jgi:hypothetical protein